ncbi:hypothetical protein HPB50_014209 [Hyalomma asiaticum]|uniref:Uncharacterized protein n=1 Tax=Hyalomma asiaticum TaxID=266040 RepID=A0ACB7THR8_HYAAI|nr:hypothetical protein HPB50_014209 [Hyalomma asiaticum]
MVVRLGERDRSGAGQESGPVGPGSVRWPAPAVALLCTLAPSAFAGRVGNVRRLGNAAGGGGAAVPAVAITAPVAQVRFEARPEVKVKLVPKPVIGYVTEPVASVEHGFKPVLTIAAGVPVSLVDGTIGGGVGGFASPMDFFSSDDLSNTLDYKW